MMKILFCIDTMSKGGAERVISNLANFLCNENEISILTLVRKKIQYELNENIKINSIYESEDKKNTIQKIFFLFKTIFKYKKMIGKIKPDVIVSFLPYSSFFSLMAGKMLKVPVIVSVRNDPKKEYQNKINYILMKLTYKNASGFVFQTEDAKKYFSQDIQNNSTIIPNPINEQFICNPYNKIRHKEIVTVGRLDEQKNQELLIKAFLELPEKYNDYKLIIYGEGNLREHLTNLINSSNAQERVILAGQVDDIKEKIYKATLFVLPSNYEGMPNALMEAMALGLPCIATDCPCGGSKFLIEDGVNGYLVPVGDKKTLTKKIKIILESTEIQKSLANKAIEIKEKVNPQIINMKWKQYIDSIACKL